MNFGKRLKGRLSVLNVVLRFFMVILERLKKTWLSLIGIVGIAAINGQIVVLLKTVC